MTHSLRYQFVHLMWATKNLEPLIKNEFRDSLLAYIWGITNNLGGSLLASSGTNDHVHLLMNTPSNISASDLLRQIKSSSSKWIRSINNENTDFSWNESYSAFTVSPTALNNEKNI